MGTNKNTICKIEWLDTVKVFTMILVVIGHCNYYNIITPYGGVSYDIDLFSFKCLGLITGFIYSFHMPLFMAVSGACFFFSMKKNPSFTQVLTSKAKRLLIPFVLVTLFLSVPLKYWSGYYDKSDNVFLDILFGQFFLMGNSHLWYVVSLFYIFIVYYTIERLNIKKGFIFWSVLVLLSWIGFKLENYLFQCAGLTGLFKHFLYFSLGYSCIFWIKDRSYSLKYILLSWLSMIGFWLLFRFYIHHFKIPFETIFALWGCVNMVFTCKNLSSLVSNSSLYKYCSQNSYGLYLYSDPFNYILITLFALYFQQFFIVTDIGIILAFLLRFVFTFLGATVVLYLLKILISINNYFNKPMSLKK